MNATSATISSPSVERLAALGALTIAAIPEEARWSWDGEFEPFVLAARGDEVCFIHAPLLSEANADIVLEAWEEVASRLVPLVPDSAAVAMPVWLTPVGTVHASPHPNGIECVAVAALGTDGSHSALLFVVERDDDVPKLGPGVWDSRDLSSAFPELADCVAEAKQLLALGAAPAPLASAADIPEELNSARWLSQAMRDSVDQLPPDLLTPSVRVEFVTPTGMRSALMVGEPEFRFGADEVWHVLLPQLVCQMEATGLTLCEFAHTLDGDEPHPGIRISAVSHADEPWRASRPPDDAGGVWDQAPMTGTFALTVLTELRRVRARQVAFERVLQGLGQAR